MQGCSQTQYDFCKKRQIGQQLKRIYAFIIIDYLIK